MHASERLPVIFNAAAYLVGRHVAEGRGDCTALVDDDGELTYAELDLAVRTFAGALRDAGVRRGDRVAFVLPDSTKLATFFLGALALGAVAVPVNTIATARDKGRVLADCDPRVVVYEAAMGAPETDAVLWETNAIPTATPTLGYADTHRDAFAFFLYSSGTTGEPKGVVHLHHDMWICGETYGREVLGIRPEDRCLSVAKLFFAYGLGNSLYLPLHAGASAVLVSERPLPNTMFERIARHRPTLFFAVPTAYANMLAAIDAGAEPDFSSVRLCVSAGEALPVSVLERWRERTGTDILDGIGSTEICHIFLSNRPAEIVPGSSGFPVPGYDVRVVDENGADVPDGEIGDLLVRGDSTMALYWNKHDATKQTLVGEWIRTGDKYHRDERGAFFHDGRSDDMIKAGGIWVSPVEVEGALVGHPDVLECAVVGRADEHGLFKPHAFVVLHEAANRIEVEVTLKTWAKERLAPYKAPRWVTVVAELPKTATGKIQRFRLR